MILLNEILDTLLGNATSLSAVTSTLGGQKASPAGMAIGQALGLEGDLPESICVSVGLGATPASAHLWPGGPVLELEPLGAANQQGSGQEILLFLGLYGLPELACAAHVSLSFPPELLRKPKEELSVGGQGHVKIGTTAWIAVSLAGDVSTRAEALALGSCEIGTTGIVLAIDQLSVHLDANELPPEEWNVPDDFVGFHLGTAGLTFPPDLQGLLPESATLKNATIGTGGFSGSLYLKYDNPSPKYENGKYTGTAGVGSIFGMAFAVDEIDINIKQNAFVSNSITGTLRIPFFDIDAKVALGLTQDGGYLLKYIPDPAKAKIEAGFADITIDSFGIQGKGTEARVVVAGTITPTVANSVIDWPTMVVKELSIDRHGNVHFEGGWVDLDKPRTIEFAGLGFEITKMGLGQDADGCPWYGLDGALKLPEGVPASGSVEGLKVRPTKVGNKWDWKQPRIEFAGIGVDFEIPDVLHFAGKVAYHKDGNDVDFRGGVTLDLYALDMTIEGTVVFGKKGQTPYFAIYLSADLPSPVPLFGSNVAVYGISGLVAVNYGPNRKPGQPWYALDHNDWYHKPPTGVADLKEKWEPKPAGAFAIGVGAELATMNDKGYSFNGHFLAVVALPGPVILLEGVANIMREQPAKKGKDDTGKSPPKPPEPMFHALAALDCNAGNLTFGLDAQWRYRDDGQLLDIAGSSEIFVDFHDASKFHIWLGKKTPEAQRVRAKILSLFEANAYLMLDKEGVQTGAKAGWSKSWKYKVAGVGVDVGAGIHISSDVHMSWNPPQFHGEAAIAGEAHILICGEGISMSLASGLAVDVPQPFRVAGDLAVSCEVWPFGTFSKTVHLEWTAPTGQPAPVDPQTKLPLPPPPVVPLADVTVRHGLTGETWPLLPGKDLLPAGLADARGFLVTPTKAPAGQSPPTNGGPVVPIDANIDLSFARPIADICKVGIGAAAVGNQVIGDPKSKAAGNTLRYELVSIALERVSDGAVIAQRPWQPGDKGEPLWGAWGAADDDPEHVNRRLRLWGVDPQAFDASSSMEMLASTAKRNTPPGAPSGQGGPLLLAPAHMMPADTSWRLHIQTRIVQSFAPPNTTASKETQQVIDQYAYFRTESGPGRANLSLPAASVASDVLVDAEQQQIDVIGALTTKVVKASPLNGLAPYLLRPVPAPVALRGGPADQWRGAAFGFDFVTGIVPKLYRGRSQEVGIRLLDRAGNWWPRLDGLPVLGQTRWLKPLPIADSATADKVQKVVDQFKALGANMTAVDLQGARLRASPAVLPPAAEVTVQAVPALLAEGFASGSLSSIWQSSTEPGAGGIGKWEIVANADQPAALRQVANFASSVPDVAVAGRPGTSLAWSPDKKNAVPWQDVAVLVRLRMGATGAAGVEVRRTDPNHFVRVVFDNDLRRWRILLATGAGVVVLAERQASLAPGVWHEVRVDAVGTQFKVAVDGRLVLDASAGSSGAAAKPAPTGTIALFAAGGGQAAFLDLWVEDLARAARPLWQTTLLTHPFASPLHLAAFAPPRASAPKVQLQQLAPKEQEQLLKALAKALDGKTTGAGLPAVSEDLAAARALKILTGAWDGLRTPAQALDVARLALPAVPPLLVLRSAVNLDWQRSTVTMYQRPDPQFLPRLAPGAVRLLSADWPASSGASLAAVELIARERCDLRGAVIIAESFAGPDVGDLPPAPLLDMAVGDAKRAGLLYAEDFAAFALDRWRTVPGSTGAWSISDGKITGSAAPNSAAMLLQPAAASADIAVLMHFKLTKGCVGLALRRNDAGGHYRVECDAEAHQLLIVDCAPGAAPKSLAYASAPGLTANSNHVLQVWCAGSDVVALLDSQCLVVSAGIGQRGAQVGLWLKASTNADVWRFVAQSHVGPLQPKGALSTQIADWQVVDAIAPAAKPSTWTVANSGSATAGALLASQSTVLPAPPTSPSASPAASQIVLPIGQVDAYTWVAHLKFAKGGSAGLGLGWQGSSPVCSFRCDQGGWKVVDKAGKPYGDQAPKAQALAADIWHAACVRVLDGRLTVWLDGVTVVDQHSVTSLGGSLTFEAVAGACAFEHLALLDPRPRFNGWASTTILAKSAVWPAPAPLPPAAWAQDDLGLALHRVAPISYFAGRSVALVAGQNLADIDLTANVGPDGLPFGLVFRWIDAQNHCVVWIDASEISATRVDQGTATALRNPMPHKLSLAQGDLSAHLVVRGATGILTIANETFEFAEVAQRAGLCGPAADTASQVCFTRVVLAPAVAPVWPELTAGAGTAWKVIDALGAKEGPSKWKFGTDGTVIQTSNLFGGPDTPDDLTRPGTVALRQLTDTPADFILRCELCGGKEPDIADALGVVFRWRSPTVFYRFSMDHERAYRRLVKVVNGIATELWADKVAYEPDRWYRLVIAAKGPDLRGWLDGVPLFAVRDDNIGSGQVGFYTWAHTNAQFRGLRLRPAPYRDGAELADAQLVDGLDSQVTLQPPAAWQWTGSGLQVKAPAKATAEGTLGSSKWTSTRTSVMVRREAVTGTVGVAVGCGDTKRVCVRFTSQQFLEIVQQSRSAATAPWTDAAVLHKAGGALPQGTWQMLTFDCVEGMIAVWQAGKHLCRVAAPSLSGGVALLATDGAAATWRQLRVEGLRRHQLARVLVRLDDGQRVRVVPASQSCDKPPTVDAGAQHVVCGDIGAEWPLDGPVRLTLTTRDREEIHALWARRRQGEDQYIACQMLRARDGRTAILVPNDGGGSPKGDQFLRWKWRCSAPGVADVPQLIELNGESGEEVVDVDV